ncbi:MAG: hypothetical protein IKL81_04260, partial [Clostridia bacterium]|nr:hypothetical protein [Clostridia bacterium]
PIKESIGLINITTLNILYHVKDELTMDRCDRNGLAVLKEINKKTVKSNKKFKISLALSTKKV